MQSRAPYSSLRGMEIAIPPGHPLPPQAALGNYGRKPLPPVPPRHPPLIPVMVDCPQPADIEHSATPDRISATQNARSMAVGFDENVRRHRPRRLSAIDASTTSSEDEGILSPRPRKPSKKFLQLTGQGYPAGDDPIVSPSLHRSSKKIKQLTGLDVGTSDDFAVDYDDSGSASPTSSGSRYSDGPGSTTSEPGSRLTVLDRFTRYSLPPWDDHSVYPALQGRESFTPSSWTSPHVAPLRMKRAGKQQHTRSRSSRLVDLSEHRRSSRRSSTSVKRRSSGYSTLSDYDLYSQAGARDLYHATASQIAESTQDRTHLSVELNRNSAASLESVKKMLSFSAKVLNGLNRKEPPPKLSKTSSFGTGNHPQKTPYPAHPPSAFDYSDNDEKSSTAKPFAKMFRGYGHEDKRMSAGVGDGTVVLLNRSRKAGGPDTPLPPATMLQRTNDQLHGLVAHAKKSAGLLSKNEKKDVVRNKIRVIPEGSLL